MARQIRNPVLFIICIAFLVYFTYVDGVGNYDQKFFWLRRIKKRSNPLNFLLLKNDLKFLSIRGGSDEISNDSADESISETTEDSSDEDEETSTFVSGKNILNEKLKYTKVEGLSDKIQKIIYRKLDENFDNITQGESFPMMVKLLKQVLVSALIIKVINSLNHENPKAVARARIAYAFYLVLAQVFIMYSRRKVAKQNDQTEIEIRGQLSGMFQKMLPGAGNSPLDGMAKDMTAKMLSKKISVKDFDSQQLDNMFNGLLFPVLFNTYLHFKKGYVKPLMIQAAMGIHALIKSPIFQIHVFGKSAEGDLARPFTSNSQFKMMEKMMSELNDQSTPVSKQSNS